MQVRCPHCQQSIDVVEESDLHNITCSSCGTAFTLIPEETLTHDAGARRTIGHFELVKRIGCGAFGEVWKATDSSLDRVVAVKIPRKGLLDAAEADQFLREARSAAKLNHPSIVGVHEVGNDEGQLFIVSDFVEGITLADWLTARRPTFREAAELCAQISDGLHHAHQNGVIHRDLKPSNIMLDVDHVPHIMDFGLAKRATGDITMTIDGKVLGTPAYMSPEQARGKAHDADQRSDIYSLGVILFELLTRELPFRGNAAMLLHQVIHDEAPSPRKLNHKVPRDLETICLRCLEKEPNKRYSAAQQVGDELRRYLAGEPIYARPIGVSARSWRWCKRNPVVATLTACLAIALLLVAWQWREAERGRKQARTNEYESMVREMAAIRHARNTGYRQNVEDLLQTALTFAPDEGQRAELRDMAVACMGDFAGFYPSQELEPEFSSLPADSLTVDINMRSSRVLYGREGGQLLVVDHITKRQFTIDPPLASPIVHRVFDETGRFVACAYESGVVNIYDGDNDWNLRATAHIPMTGRPLSAMWVSRDGTRLLTCEGWMRQVVSVLFREDGSQETEVFRLPGWVERKPDDANAPRFASQPYPVQAAFSGNGQILVVQDCSSEFLVWDVVAKAIITRIHPAKSGWHVAATLSDDAKRLAIAYGPGFEVLNLETGASELLVDDDYTTYVALCRDNVALAACNEQLGTVSIWNLPRRRQMVTLRSRKLQHYVLWLKAAFDDSGKRLVSACPRSTALWNLTVDEKIECVGSVMGVPCSAFNSDGSVIAAAGYDQKVRFWNSTTGSLVGEIAGFDSGLESLEFSPDSRFLATGSHNGAVGLYDVPSRNRLTQMTPFPPDYVWHITFSPDSRVLVASTGHTWKAWTIEDTQANGNAPRKVELKSVPTDDINACWTVRFSPDGRLLVGVTPEDDGQYRVGLWDWSTRQKLPAPDSPVLGPARCFAFENDSQHLFYRSASSGVERWTLGKRYDEKPTLSRTFDVRSSSWANMGSPKEARTPNDLYSSYTALSHDNKWLAQALGQSVLIWYTPNSSGRPAFALPEHHGIVWTFSWHPTRNLLAVGTSAGSVSIWDIEKIQQHLRTFGLQSE